MQQLCLKKEKKIIDKEIYCLTPTGIRFNLFDEKKINENFLTSSSSHDDFSLPFLD